MPKIRNLYLVAFLLSLIFLWTRFYQIETSLLFFNDIGRDFLVLFKWQESGKPPLLGPQTSALPFNQSAIYFYLLYPFYVLSGHSPYASLIAYSVFYLVSFALGLYLLRFYPRLEKSLLLVFLLITVHPQYIIQGRFVWNPSFITPFILAAFYSLTVYLVQKKPVKILLMANAFFIALATAFSYSAVPTLLAFLFLLLWCRRQVFLPYLAYLIASLGLVNLPTLFFELRHGFLLSKMMLFGEKIDQGHNFFLDRLKSLSEFVFATTPSWVILLLLFIALFAYLSHKREKNLFLEHSAWLFVFTLILTLMMPVSFHSHYVFGLLPLFFLLISFLRVRYIYLVAVFLYVVFLQAALQANYFAPARHSLSDLQSCSEKFCQKYQEPLFISNQSKYHPYHNAMEFQYLMSEAGCQVKDINTENGQASTMAVVLDDDIYEHGKTSYYELTLFGESREKEHFKCSETLEVVILEK